MENVDFVVKNRHLIEYIGKSEHIEVPEDITAIAEFAFEGNTHIKSIVMPNSVSEIGRAAFARCKKLTSIVLSNALTMIELQLFLGSENLTDIYLPENLKEIKRLAFYNCGKLSKIDLPEGVCYIGADAFRGCSLLKSIELPKGLKRIGDRAFARCVNLQDVVMLEERFDMGCELFYEACSNIEIEYSGTSEDFVNMIFSEKRIPRSWETMGNVMLHEPVKKSCYRYYYNSEKDFCIEVFCKKDNKHLSFQNKSHI